MGGGFKTMEQQYVERACAQAWQSPIAMSQERSRVVDTGVIFSAQQVERSPNVDWVKTRALRPHFGRPLEDIALADGQLKPYLESQALEGICGSMSATRRAARDGFL